MTDRPIRPARTDTFEHTVSGLLTRRAAVLREADLAAYRVAELRNDLAAIDRVLALLGYAGDADAVMPRHQRKRAFGRGVRTRRTLEALRDADGPLSGREIAERIIEAEGADADDLAFVRETIDSVGRMLRKLRDGGRVRAIKDDGRKIDGMDGPRSDRVRDRWGQVAHKFFACPDRT